MLRPFVMPEDTPQRRRRIESLVRNAFPGCHASFLERGHTGLSFRVVDDRGRLRSGYVHVPRLTSRSPLNKTWLQRQVSMATSPEPGFPRLPT
jgi:hypothetical protein